MLKNLPANVGSAEDAGLIPGSKGSKKDPLEEEMPTLSRILA